jgi:hypothetical protein
VCGVGTDTCTSGVDQRTKWARLSSDAFEVRLFVHPRTQGGEGRLEVVAPRPKVPRKYRVRRIGELTDPSAFLLEVDIIIEKLHGSADGCDQCIDLRQFSLRGLDLFHDGTVVLVLIQPNGIARRLTVDQQGRCHVRYSELRSAGIYALARAKSFGNNAPVRTMSRSAVDVMQRAGRPMTAREITDALMAEKAPRLPGSTLSTYRRPYLRPCGNGLAGWWLARKAQRNGG